MKNVRYSFLLFLALLLSCGGQSEYKSMVLAQLGFSRQATDKMLDEMEKTGKADQILAWRAGPGRAPIGWQIMHLAATEDRFANKLLQNGTSISDDWIKQFESGKPAGDGVPRMSDVRKYLKDSRAALEKSIGNFDLSRLDSKPPVEFPFEYRKIFQIMVWHEPHHQGQALATFNLYKASH
ncbi:MAG: DinB family protein [Leptospirales bacterium]|nr:DinB family protein [Leptospirales bacterium]